MSEMGIFQQVTPSGASCVILNRRWIMHLPTLWLYLPVLIVYAGLVTLWSSWPEKHGGVASGDEAEAAASVATLAPEVRARLVSFGVRARPVSRASRIEVSQPNCY
jgi:hypothetical protein